MKMTCSTMIEASYYIKYSSEVFSYIIIFYFCFAPTVNRKVMCTGLVGSCSEFIYSRRFFSVTFFFLFIFRFLVKELLMNNIVTQPSVVHSLSHANLSRI